MPNTLKPVPELTLRQLAENELRKERAEQAKIKMKALLRQRNAAVAIVAGFDLQIVDYERQIEDGTA